MKVYVLFDTVTREVIGVYSDECHTINSIRYQLSNSEELLEDFEKDYQLYGKSCVTMYGYDIIEMKMNEEVN